MVQSINQNRSNSNNGSVPVASKPQIIIQKSKEGWLVAVIFAILLVVALIIGGVAWKATQANSLSGVKEDKYQALFLANGQVYFGKLSQTDSKTVILKDIYYLQVQQKVQPKEDQTPEEAAKNEELSLAKLGKELHGPEDTMYVERDQVLFWENLKDSGQVVKAIKSNKKQ